MRPKLFWIFVLCAIFFGSKIALAGDFLIIPGQRIGAVVLGMDRASVHSILHTPSATRHSGSLWIDTWLSHAILTTTPNGDRGLQRDYLTVFFRHSRSVQIEVSSRQFKTKAGVTTQSSADAFAKRYPRYVMPHFPSDAAIHFWGYDTQYGPISDDASSPAGKHFIAYGDAVKQGIAWKYGAWGNLAPDPDPDGVLEAVIVHKRGKSVLLNPKDGLPYAGTGPARK